MELPAELHGVIAQDLRDRVRDLIGIVDLGELVGCGAGRVSVEVQVLYALPLGVERDDAGRAVRILEALRDQAYAETAYRLAEIGVIAHVAEVEFIDHGGIEGLGMAQREELCPAGGDGIEARDAGAALRYRIRVIEIEVVDEVVAGEQAQRVFASRRTAPLSSRTVWLNEEVA